MRQNGDYFWIAYGQKQGAGRLIRSGETLPISGTAQIQLTVPSALSGSAVLSLAPPHRFDNHVDHILLVDQTVLIGPSTDHHICSSSIEDAAVLVYRDGIWKAKSKPAPGQSENGSPPPRSRFVELVPGHRVSIGQLDMTLERT